MVFARSLTTSLDDLKSRITTVVNLLDENNLRGVWDEFNYRLNVVCASGGRYMEHL